MKKFFALWMILLLTAALLAACGCEHEWEEADCNDPQTCSKCGATEGEELGHDYQDANCENPKTCSRCGKSKGDALGHTWTDATCDSPKTCTVCAATEGEALGHTWSDATCEVAKTCTVCSATEGEALGHSWVDATCYDPKTCSVCAITEGEPLEHVWQDATCESNAVCTLCGDTGAEALGHDWAHATCVAAATCNRCGAKDGDPLGHDWLDATYTAPKTCSICGATEGDPLTQVSGTGLGVDIATYHSGIQARMKEVGYTQTATFLSTDDSGAHIYGVYDQLGAHTGVYLVYYLLADGQTVDALVILAPDCTSDTISDLCGAYLGAAIYVLDQENAATIIAQILDNQTVAEDGKAIRYYAEHQGRGFLMQVEQVSDTQIQFSCAVTTVE